MILHPRDACPVVIIISSMNQLAKWNPECNSRLIIRKDSQIGLYGSSKRDIRKERQAATLAQSEETDHGCCCCVSCRRFDQRITAVVKLVDGVIRNGHNAEACHHALPGVQGPVDPSHIIR
ncbi:hypothetical protein JTE90_006580 [Oedothorax gibbosus]|uniref:Uncharacterized protein n=1 Tax=Oedothorax gibbosus TaxID=931172 RepID=A0AAV6VKI7_9ARAC|nr:hypothetical protein JTE90_006580 [Oedothorax gibbosus]